MAWDNLPEIARDAVKQAVAAGASDAECTIAEGDEFSASVRMGELETLKDAGSRGAGLRVLIGRKMGASYTSDLTPEGIQQMVRSAIDLAGLTTEDPTAGLPEAGEFGAIATDLKLFSDETAKLPTEERIEIAKRAEAAALGADARITNSEGGSFDSNVGGRVFANSRGFLGSYRSSSCSVSAMPVATLNGSMERDYWYSSARNYKGLEDPETVGRKAAARALRRLGAVKVETQRVPVIFEPRTARTLLGNVCDAVSGSAIWRKASFLAGKLGEKVADERITLIDDGTIPGPFSLVAVRRRGAPTRRIAGDGARRPEELSAEQLFGAQAEYGRPPVMRRGASRASCWDRAREFLHRGGYEDAGRDYIGGRGKRIFCDRIDRQRCQYRYGRLARAARWGCGSVTGSWRSRFRK